MPLRHVKEYSVALLLLFLVLTVWVWGFSTKNFTNGDAYDYAQLGKQISEGKGFTTLQLYPRYVPLFYEKGYLQKKTWPNINRPPMPTILNAVFDGISKDTIKAAVMQSGTWYILCVPLLFILAVRISDIKTALLCTLFYASDPWIFRISYAGMTETFAVFLLLLLFITVFSAENSNRKCILLGIICGFGYLTRLQLILLLPMTIIYIWIYMERQRTRGLVFFLAGFFIVTGPWLIRNLIVAGDPFFSSFTARNLVLGSFRTHSDIEMQLEAPIRTMEVLRQYGTGIFQKFLKNILHPLKIRFWIQNFGPSSFFLFFVFASLIYKEKERSFGDKYEFLKVAVIAFILFNILTVSFSWHKARYYIYLRPFIYLIGINEMLRITGKRTVILRGVNVLICITLLLVGVSRFKNAVTRHRQAPPPVAPEVQSSYKMLAEMTDENTVIASNQPYGAEIPVQAGCRVLRLPAYHEDLLKINDDYLKIDYVIIPRYILASRRPRAELPFWDSYLNYGAFVKTGGFLRRFRFEKKLPDGSVLYKRIQ